MPKNPQRCGAASVMTGKQPQRVNQRQCPASPRTPRWQPAGARAMHYPGAPSSLRMHIRRLAATDETPPGPDGRGSGGRLPGRTTSGPASRRGGTAPVVRSRRRGGAPHAPTPIDPGHRAETRATARGRIPRPTPTGRTAFHTTTMAPAAERFGTTRQMSAGAQGLPTGGRTSARMVAPPGGSAVVTRPPRPAARVRCRSHRSNRAPRGIGSAAHRDASDVGRDGRGTPQRRSSSPVARAHEPPQAARTAREPPGRSGRWTGRGRCARGRRRGEVAVHTEPDGPADRGDDWEDVVLDEAFIRSAEVSEPAARTRMLAARWRRQAPEPQPWRADKPPAGWLFSRRRKKRRKRKD